MSRKRVQDVFGVRPKKKKERLLGWLFFLDIYDSLSLSYYYYYYYYLNAVTTNYIRVIIHNLSDIKKLFSYQFFHLCL